MHIQELEAEEQPCFTNTIMAVRSTREEEAQEPVRCGNVSARLSKTKSAEGLDAEFNSGGDDHDDDMIDKMRASFSPSNSTLLADTLLSDELMAFRIHAPQTAYVQGSG